MNKVTTQVAGVVAAVSIFALLSAVGYFTQIGLSQTLGPSAPDGDNSPSGAKKRSNSSPANDSNDRDSQSEPIPEGESVWEDYSDKSLDNLERKPDRPGNFEVVTKVGQFWESMYAVEPDYDDVAYPLRWNHKWSESKEQEDAEEEASEAKLRQSGRKKKNKTRQFNVVVSKLTLLNFAKDESGISNFADRGLSQASVDVFAEIRKKHPERCVLVLIRAAFESLQSDKIEFDRSDSDFILCYVKKSDGWKLVWFEK